MKEHQYKPVLYFLIAFAITWVNGFLLVFQSYSGGERSLLNLLLGYMGPFLAALVFFVVYRKDQLAKAFLKRVWRVEGVRLWDVPFILFLLPLAMYVSILISLIFGQPESQLSLAEELKVFNGEAAFSMIILILVPVLEELGWRGYGVDSLYAKFDLFKTSLIFGILWGAWHLPIFFIPGSYQASLWAMNPIFAINFFVGIIPLAFIMNWLYYRNNRSILVVAVFHIMVNLSSELFQANQVSKCILTLVLAAVAARIVYYDRSLFFDDGDSSVESFT